MNFPEKIGQKNQKCDQTAEPEPGLRELFALLGEYQADDKAKAEEQHGMLVEQANARDDTEEQPKFAAGAIEDFQHDKRGGHPEEGLEHVHGEQAVETEIHGRDHHADAGQKNAVATSAEFARDQAGEDETDASGDGRKKMQGRERVTERDALKPGDYGDERRLIDVAPREMVAAREVVKFVDKIAVAAANQHVRYEKQKRQPAQKCPNL